MILGGVLAKLGTYGLFRFGLGMFPDAWSVLAPYLAVWAAISVLYGAITAIAQKDIKRMVAYSSIGHMGYVLLGGAAMTDLALTGAESDSGLTDDQCHAGIGRHGQRGHSRPGGLRHRIPRVPGQLRNLSPANVTVCDWHRLNSGLFRHPVEPHLLRKDR